MKTLPRARTIRTERARWDTTTGRTLPYYYELATQYATSDRQFASVGARTPVNRMYIMGASSYGNVDFGPIPQTALTIFDRLTAAGITLEILLHSDHSGSRGPEYHTASTYRRPNPSQIVTTDEYFTDLQNGTLPTCLVH